ncbi:MAG: hypothetical protein Ct9H300mP8_03160 [Gammaproteobacteria bacterium]|nr:MAG: hypothetical protein Ct9H300mP8_03160 [Gammaproteobacteria bacterium]
MVEPPSQRHKQGLLTAIFIYAEVVGVLSRFRGAPSAADRSSAPQDIATMRDKYRRSEGSAPLQGLCSDQYQPDATSRVSVKPFELSQLRIDKIEISNVLGLGITYASGGFSMVTLRSSKPQGVSTD